MADCSGKNTIDETISELSHRDGYRSKRRYHERERCRASEDPQEQAALIYEEAGYGVDFVRKMSGVTKVIARRLVTGE